MAKRLNTRATAAKLSWQVIDKGQSLDAVLAEHFAEFETSPQDRGFTQELCYGVCRWYGQLDAIAAQLLKSPIRNKDRVVHFVLLVGLYQLTHLNTADHAAVGETVNACKQLNKQWAKNLINGCLRTAQRESDSLDANLGDDQDELAHPDWIAEAIKTNWPEHAKTIFTANNQRPPMCLRVNSRLSTRDDYLERLKQIDIAAKQDPYSKDGIILDQAVAVTALPDFAEGACSVQDTAAQLACDFLQIEQGMTVLDACAAPGGKTAHMLERADDQLSMHALDISERRCEQLYGTLGRLDLDAQVFCADASVKPSWPVPSDGYDRILIDAPCSGLGVIRRHPDIKHHRRIDDIDKLNQVQQNLLSNLWQHLKPNGLMLYMTCSILQRENQHQAKAFLAEQEDASIKVIQHPKALALEVGVQTLPGVHDMDGFYYCLIRKQA